MDSTRAPKITSHSLNQAPLPQTNSIEADKSELRNENQGGRRFANIDSLNIPTFAVSSTNLPGANALMTAARTISRSFFKLSSAYSNAQPSRQLAIPTDSSGTTSSKTPQKPATGSDMPSSFPPELSFMIIGEADCNPMSLMTLTQHKNSEGKQSTLSQVAWDNNIWVSFAPQTEKTEAIPEGYHAQQFIDRYQAMPPADQELLKTLWTGTYKKKHIVLLELERRPLLLNDYDFMRAAVCINGHMLEYASEALKNDRSIVLAAVKQNCWALRYVPENLQNDREIMLAAISQNGETLQNAPENLRGDREFMLAAVSRNNTALRYAHSDLQNDPELRALAGWPPSL